VTEPGPIRRLLSQVPEVPTQAEAERGLRDVLDDPTLQLLWLDHDGAYLGADDLLANSLQFVEGFATGKVIPPIVEGANKANRVREYCVRHGLRLDLSHAYSDSLSDYPMLTVVGRPTVVNPDRRLRSHARAYEWPILDLTLTGRKHLPR